MKSVPKIEISERVLFVGSRLNYHGPLSSNAIGEYEDESARGTEMFLRKLFLAGYIEKPIKRTKAFIPGPSDPTVYGNTALMDEALKKRNFITHSSTALSIYTLAHERFLAAVTSSIELLCIEKNFKYLFEIQLLAKAPAFTRMMPCHIEYKGVIRGKHSLEEKTTSSDEALKPDAYFGIDNGRLTVYFLEVDRKKEDIWSTDLKKESWRSKFLKYMKIMDTRYHLKHFGLPDNTPTLCLFVFNDAHRMQSAQDELLHITNNKGRPYMLFQSWSEFIDPTYIPKEVNRQFLENPWYRAGHDINGKEHAPIFIV